ncbi:CaiB/BaiF CoA transferase family protein [Leucobacter chinensis]|uniref:CaiB/BaiF CoA transferase family protein n=1 Tax=Leucobacter chinensis TaxID=2851010 RepID=UPI001C2116C0|nr:CoA transferase [Leucobacter chinensis]
MLSQQDPAPEAPRGALGGIRVADFSRVLAGPHATMMLADLGADVIKIESPAGDGTRAWVPPANALGQSTYFAGVNRGKRSVVIDLSTDEGRATAMHYATTADVVIQNFKPGTMERFGLGYETVAEANPGVVYCSISGFGDGGGKDLPGYDLLVQAVGGLMSITGAEGGEPQKVGVALVDVLTGQNAVIGIQAALRARDDADSPTRGRGQHVKVNLLSTLLSSLANQASSTLETGVSPQRMGNAHPSIAPYETFETADQTIVLAVGTDGQFRALCEVLELAQVADDERFVSNELRVANRAALGEIITEKLSEQPAQHWIDACMARKIPAGRVNSVGQAFELAEQLGLGAVAQTGEVRSVANPIDLGLTPASYTLAPPHLGEHTGADWLPATNNR